jgi:uncharacterized protein
VYTRSGAHTHTRAHLHETTLPKFPAVTIVKKTAPARRIQTRRSGVHGKGVYALVDLAEGETVIEYVGEVITWDEALRRHPHDPKDPNHTFYFHIDEDHVIDAKFGGNSSRWINHSCAPTARPRPTRAGSSSAPGATSRPAKSCSTTTAW